MRFLAFLLSCLLLTGCASADNPTQPPAETPPATTVPAETTQPTEPPDPIRERMDLMSLPERVGQLFLARCSASTAIQDIQQYHLGGFVLFGADFREETPESLKAKLKTYQNAAKIPLLLAVDEEGGTVTRVSRYPAFRDSNFASPRNLYAWGGMEWVLAVEEEKSALLSGLGLNVNLAPVCDITTNPASFMYDRSLGQDTETTSQFVSGAVTAMARHQVGSVLKHFPGYGNNTDTHVGMALDTRSLEELEGCDLIPFAAGIEAGCGGILVSHTFVNALDSELPASLSPSVHQYLRQEMGFHGVIVTDDLVMQAITDLYGAGEAAVLAVLAGNDLLISTEYALQYEAVLAAVLDGRIDMDTLNSAVYRVLEWKTELGLM